MVRLGEILAAHTGPAAPELVQVIEGNRVRCLACAHRCRIPPGKRGICRIRFNDSGTLRVPRGYVSGLQVDPIEKKPFFHVLPGADALSFGMLGCDLHCPFCQNWLTSQTLRDEAAGGPVREAQARDIVRIAVDRGAPIVTSTYNEPLITAEWAAEIFDLAKEKGLRTAFVSNGNATPEVIDYLASRLDMMNVDLKSFSQEHYRELGGVLQHVLETIEGLHRRGIWLEVVTLVVPGFNDSDEELSDIAAFLAGISPGIPWHVTAFHPDYRMRDRGATPARTLLRACEIGREQGLHHVYAGNLPGRLGHWENTVCPSCGTVLVERTGYFLGRVVITPGGSCPSCGTAIPGIWS